MDQISRPIIILPRLEHDAYSALVDYINKAGDVMVITNSSRHVPPDVYVPIFSIKALDLIQGNPPAYKNVQLEVEPGITTAKDIHSQNRDKLRKALEGLLDFFHKFP